MDCERIQRLISALIDGEVSPDDRVRVEGHLSKCPSCRQEKQEMEAAARLISAALPTISRDLPRAITSSLPTLPRPQPVALRWMSIAAGLLLAAGLVFLLVPDTDPGLAPPEKTALIGYLEGDVLHVTNRAGEKTASLEWTEVREGDTLENPRPLVARLTLDVGAQVAIAQGTRIRVETETYEALERETVVTLEGDGEVIVSLDPQRVPFVVRVGDIQVRALGTIFGVTLSKAGGLEVRVFDGAVAVDTEEGSKTIYTGEAWSDGEILQEEVDPPLWAAPALPQVRDRPKTPSGRPGAPMPRPGRPGTGGKPEPLDVPVNGPRKGK